MFLPEDRDRRFLSNISNSQSDYVTLHPRRQSFSSYSVFLLSMALCYLKNFRLGLCILHSLPAYQIGVTTYQCFVSVILVYFMGLPVFQIVALNGGMIGEL